MLIASLPEEVLYALLGYPGSVVVLCADGTFGLADDLVLDPSERRLIERLLQLGTCSAALDGFVTEQLYDWRGGGARDPHIAAFATGLEECLAPYRSCILALEQRLIADGTLPLLELQLSVDRFCLALPRLRSLAERVRAEAIGAAPLLDLLSDEHAVAVGHSRECVRLLLWHVQRVFLAQLSTWLLHGELLPASAA